jgi:hypothetical protein
MHPNSDRQQTPKWFQSYKGRSLLSAIRTIVSFWRGYIDLHSWVLVFYLVVLVVTRSVFTIAGLVFALGLALYAALFLLERWLRKHE